MEVSTADEIKANMQEAGLEVHADPAINAARLAAYMVDEI